MSEYDRLKKQYDALKEKQAAPARRMYDALKQISQYMTAAEMNRKAERLYGLDCAEAIEMAYDNVIAEAKAAIKGMKRP